MKLPGVAIAVPFLSSIALGLHPLVARHAASFVFLSLCFFAVSLLAGVHIFRTDRDRAVHVLTEGTRLEIFASWNV